MYKAETITHILIAIIIIYSNITHHVHNTRANIPAIKKPKYAYNLVNLDDFKNKMLKSVIKISPLNQQIDVKIP